MKKLVAIIVLAVGMALAMQIGVSAAGGLNPACTDGTLKPGSPQYVAAGCTDKGAELEARFPVIVTVLFGIAGALAVGMIIYAGIKMTMSQGDSSKVEQEKKTITYAVIGLIVVIASYAIVRLIVEVF